MTTALIIAVVVALCGAGWASVAAVTYKRQRDEAEQRATKALSSLAVAEAERNGLRQEYDAFRQRAHEAAIELAARHTEATAIISEEAAVYKEVLHAKLDAGVAADISAAASRMLQERQRRREGGVYTGPRAPTLPK